MKFPLSVLTAALLFIMPHLAFADGGILPRDNRNNAAAGGVDSDDQDGEVFPFLLDPVTGELLVKSSTTMPVGAATELKQDDIIAELVKILIAVLTGQTATEPVVISIGTTPTLIAAASATTRDVTIQNMDTVIVFLGKAAVTTGTGIGIRGGVAANDAKGQTARANHGDAIFGIVASGTANVRVQVVSD